MKAKSSGEKMMNNPTGNDLTNNKLKTRILDLPIFGTKTEITSSKEAEPPKSLIFIAAFLQKPQSQDDHIKLLKKRFKRDLKEFRRWRACLLLIKNIVVENWSLFVAVKDRLWKWVKWIAGFAVIKTLFTAIYNYFFALIK